MIHSVQAPWEPGDNEAGREAPVHPNAGNAELRCKGNFRLNQGSPEVVAALKALGALAKHIFPLRAYKAEWRSGGNSCRGVYRKRQKSLNAKELGLSSVPAGD